MPLFAAHFQTVDKLREHLNRLLPRMGKKKIDSLVVNYVAKLVGFKRKHFNLQVIFILCFALRVSFLICPFWFER